MDYTTATVERLQAELAAAQAETRERQERVGVLARFCAGLIMDENRTYRMLQPRKLERSGLFDLGIQSQPDGAIRLSLVPKPAFATKQPTEVKVG